MAVEQGRRIKCSVKTFFWTNLLWGVLCLAFLIFGLMGLFYEEGVLVLIPKPAYYIVIALFGYGLVVSMMGMFGQTKKVEICFLCYIILIAIGILLQTLAFIYALLYANSVATGAKLDTFAEDLQADLESFLFDFAQEKTSDWESIQNSYSCCGIDFEAGVDLDPTQLANLESGDACNAVNTTVLDELRANASLAATNNQFDPETEIFLPAELDPTFGKNAGYFCKDVFRDFTTENTIYIGIVLGVVVIAQMTSIIAAARMYCVYVEDGGWYYETEEGWKKAEDYEGGNKTFNQVKAFGNRVSMRFNHATTPNPEAPPNAGMFGRLSMRGSPFSGNQLGQMNGPGQPVGPPGGGAKPSFLKRVSQRLPMGGIFGFPRGPPPMGGPRGPPPMGGGPPPMGGGPPPMGGGPPPMGGGPPPMGGGPRGPPPMGGGPPPMGGGPRGPPPMGGGPPPMGGGPRGPPPMGGMGGGLPPMGGGLPGPNSGMGGPMGAPPRAPPRGFGKRISARLTAGLNNIRKAAAPSRFGGGLPAPNSNLPGPNTNVGMSGPPPPRGGMGGGPPALGGMGGPPRGGMGGPPRGGMGGPPPPNFGNGPPKFSPPPKKGGGMFGRSTRGGGRSKAGGGGSTSTAAKDVKPKKGDQPPPSNPLMAAIQGGARLKKTVTNDRSAPKV